jgi:hypothetical protein
MLLQLALQLALDLGSIFRRDPIPLDEKVGERLIKTQGPAGTNVSELSLVDEIVLQSNDCEQQVPVDVDFGWHLGNLSRLRSGFPRAPLYGPPPWHHEASRVSLLHGLLWH